jgi:hypothetical protein
LPDYTCRVTIDRAARRTFRAPFEPTDRIRLEVVYTGGNELYAWPDSGAFERSIEELLPAHGLVSNGSYAGHVRTLFLRDVARFSAPRREGGHLLLDASVPAALSGLALSTSSAGVPAAIDAAIRLDGATLDLERLEVHVATRLAQSVEVTTYGRVQIGDFEFVLPQTSELQLIAGDGTQFRNTSRFDRYRRYTGTSEISFEPGAAATPSRPANQPPAPTPAKLAGSLDAPLPLDAAIGDPFTLISEDGARLTGRITAMRRTGKDRWDVELTLQNHTMRARLPIGAGTKLSFGKM